MKAYKTVFLSIIVLLILGCSSSQQIRESDLEAPESKYDESFDPNLLNDDDIVIVKTSTGNGDQSTNIKDIIPNTDIEYREANGFRVQVVATKNIETATLTEQEVKDLFSSMNHKVYLIFEAPMYKIRIGDVTDRDAAEDIRDIAKDYGYREAFIVPTKVNIPINESF